MTSGFKDIEMKKSEFLDFFVKCTSLLFRYQFRSRGGTHSWHLDKGIESLPQTLIF